MTPLALLATADAHPPRALELAPDAHERLADEILLGPPGCFVAEATIAWEHASGGFSTRGRADATWRFDQRVWHLDRFVLTEADQDSLEVRIAPLLLGVSIHASLRYPTTPHRIIDWPSPSATLPRRLFGEIESVSIDTLEDGSKRVVEAFDWDGWKRVTGERRVTFGPRGTEVVLDATDRWPSGCSVRSAGFASLGPEGMPQTERWTFEGDCPLRDWLGEWRFSFGTWRRCETPYSGR